MGGYYLISASSITLIDSCKNYDALSAAIGTLDNFIHGSLESQLDQVLAKQGEEMMLCLLNKNDEYWKLDGYTRDTFHHYRQ